MPRQTVTKIITAADFTALLDRADISDSDFMAITGTHMWELQALLDGRENLNMAEILLLELLAAGALSSSHIVNLSKRFTEIIDIGPTRAERRANLQWEKTNGS